MVDLLYLVRLISESKVPSVGALTVGSSCDLKELFQLSPTFHVQPGQSRPCSASNFVILSKVTFPVRYGWLDLRHALTTQPISLCSWGFWIREWVSDFAEVTQKFSGKLEPVISLCSYYFIMLPFLSWKSVVGIKWDNCQHELIDIKYHEVNYFHLLSIVRRHTLALSFFYS